MLNLGSWLVRWIAYREHDVAIWLQQGKPEAEWPWVFRNIPFANLYDLSLGFAFGAGITTLLIAHRRNFRFLGAVSLPLASLILILARFIGDDIIGLQPVLDSYWRPIHVGIAALSYGIALVCFATAIVYLLKDGVKTEAMAVWSSIFSLSRPRHRQQGERARRRERLLGVEQDRRLVRVGRLPAAALCNAAEGRAALRRLAARRRRRSCSPSSSSSSCSTSTARTSARGAWDTTS